MDDLQQVLKDKGLRNTLQRHAVLQQLAIANKSGQPISVLEIAQGIKRYGEQIDIASIYRTLELFIDLGIAQELEFGDGKKHYEIATELHHHHVICRQCGLVAEIDLPLEERIVSDVAKQSDFVIKNHTMEFFGFCKDCQKKGST